MRLVSFQRHHEEHNKIIQHFQLLFVFRTGVTFIVRNTLTMKNHSFRLARGDGLIKDRTVVFHTPVTSKKCHWKRDWESWEEELMASFCLPLESFYIFVPVNSNCPTPPPPPPSPGNPPPPPPPGVWLFGKFCPAVRQKSRSNAPPVGLCNVSEKTPWQSRIHCFHIFPSCSKCRKYTFIQIALCKTTARLCNCFKSAACKWTQPEITKFFSFHALTNILPTVVKCPPMRSGTGVKCPEVSAGREYVPGRRRRKRVSFSSSPLPSPKLLHPPEFDAAENRKIEGKRLATQAIFCREILYFAVTLLGHHTHLCSCQV